MATTTTTTTTTTNIPRRQRATVLPTAVLTTGSALALNLAVFGVARARDISFVFPQPGSDSGTQTVTAGAVAAFTVTTMIIGWIIGTRAASHHRPTLRTTAIIAAAISTVSTMLPLTVNAGLSVKLTLASLHVITGGCYIMGIAALRRSDTERARS